MTRLSGDSVTAFASTSCWEVLVGTTGALAHPDEVVLERALGLRIQ